MKRLTAFLVASLMIGVFAPTGHTVSSANFHVSCRFSHLLPDDPIVYPGKAGAAHMHQFFGNVSASASSTTQTMLNAGTTCDFAGDTSGYWVPALIDKSGKVYQPLRMSAYYWNRGVTVTAPPSGLKIIAGGDTADLKTAGYACGEGMPTSPVPYNCGSKLLKGVVAFPSCWDGKNLDSADHRSHMAYGNGKGCPATHPVAVPRLIVHVTYGLHDGTGYSLASDKMAGTRDGRSLHADFWNTWQQQTLVDSVGLINAGITRGLGSLSDVSASSARSSDQTTTSAPQRPDRTQHRALVNRAHRLSRHERRIARLDRRDRRDNCGGRLTKAERRERRHDRRLRHGKRNHRDTRGHRHQQRRHHHRRSTRC